MEIFNIPTDDCQDEELKKQLEKLQDAIAHAIMNSDIDPLYRLEFMQNTLLYTHPALYKTNTKALQAVLEEMRENNPKAFKK